MTVVLTLKNWVSKMKKFILSTWWGSGVEYPPIASVITIVSISFYGWFSYRNAKQGLMILALLLALYAILYSLLQLEDYALLMGTGLLLSVLFVLMWVTRNLNVDADETP